MKISLIQSAIAIIKYEIALRGRITRQKAIRIFMDSYNIKEITSGSVYSIIDKALCALVQDNIIKKQGRGLYIKM